MSDDKDFEDWWDTIKDEWRGHKLELEFAYLAGKRKGEEERDELAEKNETLTKLVDSDTSYILKIGDELAKERAVVDWYADAYYWDAGAYSDISTIDSGDIEKVGKRLIGGKRARARQKERSEG